MVRSQISILSNKRYKKFKKCYAYFYKQQRQIKFIEKRYSELKLKEIWPKSIVIKNISINIDERLVDFKRIDSNSFDEFIKLKLPYFKENKHLTIKVNFPVKYHKHSLKYDGWNRRKTVQLKYIGNNFYFKVFFEKENVKNKNTKNLGIDLGYNKLIADSDGNTYGKELKDIYKKINNRIQGSKKFKQTLAERNNRINEVINTIDFSEISTVYVEDLKQVFYKKKRMQDMKRWNYAKVLQKLFLVCEDKGIDLIKVNPAYTSQTCSNCGTIDKENRNGEKYHCSICGMEMDADLNAAINILRRGVYSPPNT
jgi:putative transposase